MDTTQSLKDIFYRSCRRFIRGFVATFIPLFITLFQGNDISSVAVFAALMGCAAGGLMAVDKYLRTINFY